MPRKVLAARRHTRFQSTRLQRNNRQYPDVERKGSDTSESAASQVPSPPAEWQQRTVYGTASSNGQSFLRIARDTWLYLRVIQQQTLLFTMARRGDVIIDFTDAPDEVLSKNILSQDSSRGPNGRLDRRVHQAPMKFLKFVAEGNLMPDSATVGVRTILRPHQPTNPSEAVVTCTFTGRFVLHFHNNEHEDMRMMLQFQFPHAPAQSLTLIQSSSSLSEDASGPGRTQKPAEAATLLCSFSTCPSTITPVEPRCNLTP